MLRDDHTAVHVFAVTDPRPFAVRDPGDAPRDRIAPGSAVSYAHK
jgi:hypothetical protein